MTRAVGREGASCCEGVCVHVITVSLRRRRRRRKKARWWGPMEEEGVFNESANATCAYTNVCTHE